MNENKVLLCALLCSLLALVGAFTFLFVYVDFKTWQAGTSTFHPGGSVAITGIMLMIGLTVYAIRNRRK